MSRHEKLTARRHWFGDEPSDELEERKKSMEHEMVGSDADGMTVQRVRLKLEFIDTFRVPHQRGRPIIYIPITRADETHNPLKKKLETRCPK